MTEEKIKREKTKGLLYSLNIVTKSISKIKALVVLICGLALTILTFSEKILGKLSDMGWYTPRPCVEITDLIVPAKVKYSEWNKIKITIKGINNCSKTIGLYVTFEPKATSKPRIVLAPNSNKNECKIINTSQQIPQCWESSKPIKTGKGTWDWSVSLPVIERLSDPLPIEDISVQCFVKDLDAPNKPPIFSKLKDFQLIND